MPRFFLHISNGDGVTRDESGAVFADIEAARAEAIRSARSIMAEEMQSGELHLQSYIDVEDERHQSVLRVAFSEAVLISR